MPRLNPIDPAQATGKTKELLETVQKKLGFAPNMMRTMAASAAVLDGYLSFSGALGGGKLNAKLREQIAIAAAEANSCEYCLSAHTAIGKLVGLNENDLVTSRRASSSDPKVEAALNFSHEIVVRRGEVTTEQIEQVRQAGYGDGEIAEIVANVALNIFTNYFNVVAQTEVDFPKITLSAKSTA
jgi:uncharacterized peroxidase-related enzyme